MTESAIVNEWIAKAQQESELKGMREATIRVLNARFPGQVPDDVLATLEQQRSLAVLSDWIGQAAVLPLDQFRAYSSR